MVYIVKRKYGDEPRFYIYDNIKDDKTGKFRRVYLGVANEDDYNKYLEDRKRRSSNPNYCPRCGGRIAITIPPYLRERVRVCVCGET